MAAKPRILIAGGYGTFGRLLARALRGLDVEVVIAGRDRKKAGAAAEEVGALPLALDLDDVGSVARAAAGCFAVVCTAGPFQDLDRRLPSVVSGAGAHWLDTADEAGWILDTIDLTNARDTSIVPGVSSTPAITGALTRWCASRVARPARARVGLLIGNRNAKGAGSIASVLLSGLHEPTPVSFPDGVHTAYRFPSADRELLRRALGIEAEMRVALGWGPAAAVAASAGRPVRRLPRHARSLAVRALSTAARPLGLFGRSGGVVQAEVWDRAGASVGAALASDSQDLAIVPCVVALERLLSGSVPAGVVDAATLLPPDEWIAALCARGLRFHRRSRA